RVTAATLRRACGQLLSVGFDGPSAPPELLGRIRDSEVGGVMLFRPNIASPSQVAELVAALRGASDDPFLVSIDQEGGVVRRLRAVELAPFAAAAAAGLEAIMTAHVMYPALDPDRPATLSRRIVGELLRQELRFEGVIVSDDLGMKAVADRWPIEVLVVE